MKVFSLANNQYVITTNKGTYLQSYASIVAFKAINGSTYLGPDYRYSRTTMKYLCKFLNLSSIKEVDMLLSNGTYILDADLELH